MSHALITVDGLTLLDAELDQWQERPPEQFADLIKPGHTPMPWMRATLVVLMDALLHNQPIRIHIRTYPSGFSFDCDHRP